MPEAPAEMRRLHLPEHRRVRDPHCVCQLRVESTFNVCGVVSLWQTLQSAGRAQFRSRRMTGEANRGLLGVV